MQEAKILAFLSKDINQTLNITENRDSHCLLAKQVFEELKDLSDEEIKKNHKDKRQIGKIANFTVSFGGNGYTIAKNLNKPIELGNKIYNSYKDLYKGVFEWGQVVYDKSIETGYIESFDGFKLKLPYFEEFKQLETKISSFSKEFWETYRTGKEEYILLKENTEKRKEDKELKKYKIKNKEAYNHYINYKDYVSKYFKRKSEYFRLCLNNPCQAGAASMTKRAVIMLFNKIKENNHLQKVRICSVIYDEVLIEVKEELAEQYRVILEECMVNAGSYFVNNSPITITGTANIGDSWYECK